MNALTIGMTLVLLTLSGCGAAEDMTPEDIGSTVEELADPINKYGVGVIPIDATSCPADYAVTIYMDDEDDDNESDLTGWDLPQTYRRERRHNTGHAGTTFHFCKVDGRNFKSLTKFASKTSYFYATLKLGQYCPNGSVEMVRDITNEENDNQSAMSGPASPNYDPGNVIRLFFCMFGASTDKMRSFPDLGMEYAVFHDYDGPQPDLFFMKKWVYSDDEDVYSLNETWPGSGANFDAFSAMVGGGRNTMYDLGQVQ